MKHSTKFLLILLLLLQMPSFGQVTGDFRSKSSGNWGDFSIWQVYSGTAWVDATAGQFPSGTSESNATSAYIEAGHSVTLTSDQSCKNLFLNTTADVVRINTQNNVLSVWGKMSFYEGTTPVLPPSGVIATSGILGWISTGTSGSIRFRGTADRIIMQQKEVNANNTNSGWNLDFAFDPGFTGEIKDRIRAGNMTVSSGTLFVNNPTGELRIGTNNGSSDVTPNGQFLVKSGATLKGGSGIFKKSDVAAASITVESGANLIIDKSFYVLAAASLNLNGTVTLQKNIKFPTSASRASAASVGTFNNLILEGPGADTLQNNITVNGRLTLKGTSSLVANSFNVSYGSSGSLEYNGSAAQFTTNSEFPSSNGPANLIIKNSNGVSLHASRALTNQISLDTGLFYLGNNDLTLGANSPAVSGSLSSSTMIVTNGIGRLSKIFSSAGSYLYPVGDTIATDEYTPATIQISSASVLDGSTYFGIRVNDKAHPAAQSASSSLSRYWEANTNMTGLSYNGSFQYLANDVNGTEGNLKSFIFDTELSSSTKTAVSNVNAANHLISFTNSNKGGFISAADFGCTISNNTITTSKTVYCNSASSVVFTGSTPVVTSGSPQYQWQKRTNGGQWINASNGQTKDFTEATLTAGVYDYKRLVSDPTFCSDASESNVITITVNAGPAIVTNPSNVLTCSSSSASFIVVASGANLSYQWEESSNGGASFSPLSNGGIYNGATDDTLIISSVPANYNSYRYRCKVTGCSIVYSTQAYLNLSSPTINTNTPSRTICSGSSTTFGITASGPGLTYQWQVSTDGGSSFNNVVNGGVYSNATTNTLTITAGTPSMNNYKYKCVVSGSCSSVVLTSAIVTLTVNTAPSITANPVDVTSCNFSSASFNVTASGTSISYQWEVSTNGGSSYSTITDGSTYSGTTTASLSIPSIPSNFDNYRFRCKVSGCSIAYSTSARLTLGVPSITMNPSSRTICSGGSTTFNAAANGTGVNYQWQESTDGGATFNNITNGGVYNNATTNVLSISGALPTMNSNRYKCVVTGGCSSTTLSTSIATLTLLTAPSVVSNPTNTTACLNSDASFTVSATGNSLSYQWEVSTNGGSIYTSVANGTNYSNATTSTLNVIAAPASFNNYRFRCKVSGCSVTYSSYGLLTVNSGCGAKLMAIEEAKPTLQAYPNPFINQVSLNGFEGKAKVFVKDLGGKTIAEFDDYVANETLVLPNELIEGIYIVELKSDSEFKTVKLIKTR